ncbi:transglycosylase domain-containing protein [Methylobacterium oryzisoli]|uniref:transglycosylase domain-containing protein n=1 Tax=Methylobacterium oryzisoli TaxID=3385502 RepID=UPI0038929B1A
MAKGRDGRVEPRFDAPEGRPDPAALDLRLTRGDRAGASVARSKTTGGKATGGQRPRAPAPAPRRRRSFLGRVAYGLVILGVWGVVALAGLVAYHASQLPPIDQLAVPKRPPNIAILASDGSLLANRGETGGRTVAIRELPPHLPRAFVAIEDRRFYGHLGIDPIGIARALFRNLTSRGVAQGGSTLTQQLAKNLFLTQERTASRKIQEAILALWLEHRYSKDEILELYLNRVYFGAGAYGVEAAAQRYFAKPAKDVTLAEAAMLGGLVQAPSRLAPNRNLPAAQARAAQVLAAMQDLGFAKPAEVKAALDRPAKPNRAPGGGSANYVADLVMDVLDDYVGTIESDVTVSTTVDPVLQAAAEKALVDELTQKGARFNVGQGAVVAMRPDGAIRALVGGRDYAQSQFNRATTAKRQPGSAFKPFVYLAAIERGLTPDTVREDSPVTVKGWSPENYTRSYAGSVTLRDALAHSLNTVAVKLGLEVGPKAVVQTAQRLGITSPLQANASISLGTSEVTPLELVGAYAVFANGGTGVIPYVIASVKTVGGKVVYKRSPAGLGRVVDPAAVGMMNAMLHEVFVSGTAKKGDIPGYDLAGKTGTSQDFRDAWVVGYSSTLVTGVWLGNDDGESTKRVSGGNLPVEIWNRFMTTALRADKVAALPGAGRWRRGGNAIAAAGSDGGIGGLIGGLLAEAPAPAPPRPVSQQGRGGPSREDRNFLERLFGIGE